VKRLREVGLSDATIDREGNVVAHAKAAAAAEGW